RDHRSRIRRSGANDPPARRTPRRCDRTRGGDVHRPLRELRLATARATAHSSLLLEFYENAVHISVADVFAGVRFRRTPRYIPSRRLTHRWLGPNNGVAYDVFVQRNHDCVGMRVETPFGFRRTVE